jgi:uncharacterized RDD family membrane protein YckC
VESSGTLAEPSAFVPAPIGRRLCAALIDLGIAGAPFAFIPWSDLQWEYGILHFNVQLAHLSPLHLLVVSWATFYSLTKDGWSGGGSIGKKAFGLRVVDLQTKQQCTVGASAIRALILSSLPFFEVIFLLSSANHRRLGDRAAGTVVVRDAAHPTTLPELSQ